MDRYLVGLFDDEEIMLDAVKGIRQDGHIIHDALTPFPVHGLDEALGLAPTRLHSVGFVAGATGTTLALTFMTWANAFNYPLNIGGKPYFALPSFIPITFELTVLFASVTMFLTFLVRNRLFPGNSPRIFDVRTTDHLFALTFELGPDGEDDAKEQKLTAMLQKAGAVEVKIKDFSDEDDD